MLSTCGRLEIYADIDEYETGVAQLKAFLNNFRHANVTYELESYLYTLLGNEAVEHLLRVSTGLDSMLIGEAEILGQVKDAYALAQRAKTVGKTLHRLFNEALNAGKTARSQTRIGEESTSIATTAIQMAKARLGTLDGVSILVVGAGKMGRTAVRRLRDEGAADLIVTNRSIENAQELIDEVGFGHAAQMPELVESLAAADIAIASTGASHFVLTPESVAAAMAKRPERPLFVIDIAVPRDADPAIALIPNVALVDIDHLNIAIDEKLEVRREAIPRVEEIVDEYATRFWDWYRARSAVPVIAALTQKAEAVRAAELERLLARCPELSEREKMLVAGMSMTIVSKLLHSAVNKLREKALAENAEALPDAQLLEELFELHPSVER